MKYMIVLLFIVLTVVACNNKTTIDKDAVSFYEYAKDKDVELFFGLLLIPRKFDVETGKYELSRIVAEFLEKGDREQINLPVIKRGFTDEQLFQLPFYNNLQEFSNKKGISVDSVCVFIGNVVALYEELKAVEIISHPDLGKFIIFKINAHSELVYLPNKSEVYND